jgi:hypothetical protein
LITEHECPAKSLDRSDRPIWTVLLKWVPPTERRKAPLRGKIARSWKPSGLGPQKPKTFWLSTKSAETSDWPGYQGKKVKRRTIRQNLRKDPHVRKKERFVGESDRISDLLLSVGIKNKKIQIGIRNWSKWESESLIQASKNDKL